jgi:hypothetical protein
LYLPLGYNPSIYGPLPCLIWSYPGEFKNREAVGQVHRSPNKFARISNYFPLLWLARGYSVPCLILIHLSVQPFFFASPIYLPYSLIIGTSYRFAILADPTIPIISEESQEPNDK